MDKIEQLISQMTLKEKTDMLHSYGMYDTQPIERLGIPRIRFSDGPMGIRGEFLVGTDQYVMNSDDLGTSFPCPAAVAATWNPQRAFENGKALGREVRGCGRDVSLTPGINIMRTPVCGRNFEYLSEDPYLISKIAPEIIKGVQENDVAACVKHFAANNQETRRGDVNVEIDERTFREIYLPGFEAAVKEGKTMSIMGAYNQFRGEYCCQSEYLMKELLRGEWKFDGVVVSDWGALHDTEKALEAGVDFDMSWTSDYDEYPYANPLIRLIEAGEVKEEALDEIIRRVLKLMFDLKMFDENRQAGAYNTEENRQAALNVARESIVLLKNEKKILPLQKDSSKKILLIGENANRQHAFSGGSSEVRAFCEVTPYLGIKMLLGGNYDIKYAPGYTSSKDADTETRERLAKEACEMAVKADVVIYVGGLNHEYDIEGQDRADMKLPYGQDELIKELLKAKPDMVVVNLSGSPVEMRAWIDEAATVVQYWYSGSLAGTALAEVLFGDVNPSGKLAATFPKHLEDAPAHRFGEFPGEDSVTYNERIYVGYRYYDTYNVESEFCFGHGLSYTEFDYSDIHAEVVSAEVGKVSAFVSCTVKNVGERAGAEVAQLYVSDKEASVDRPAKELKGFRKVMLKPGESKTITFVLKDRDFSFYDVENAAWKWEQGEFDILVGSSSRKIRLSQTIIL